MKRLTTIILLIISGTTYSQNLKDILQGEWICSKIVDSNNVKTFGKFGESDEFLCFIFKKSTLRIQEIPFDYGIVIPEVKFETDQVKLIPGFAEFAPDAMSVTPEQSYKVIHKDKNFLILETTNLDKRTIYYHFNRRTNSIKTDQTFKYGIIVKGIRFFKTLNPQYEYLPSDTSSLNYGQAYFKGTFGQFIAINFKFPKDFPQRELSQPTTVEFTITSKGEMQNFKIINSIDDTIDSNLLKAIKRTEKKWETSFMGQTIESITFRFDFQFYLDNNEN